MITPERQEILRILEQLSELTPDVRFGQLIANLPYLAIGPTNEAIGDMEAEQLLSAVRQHIADLSNQASNVTGAPRGPENRRLLVNAAATPPLFPLAPFRMTFGAYLSHPPFCTPP